MEQGGYRDAYDCNLIQLVGPPMVRIGCDFRGQLVLGVRRQRAFGMVGETLEVGKVVEKGECGNKSSYKVRPQSRVWAIGNVLVCVVLSAATFRASVWLEGPRMFWSVFSALQ